MKPLGLTDIHDITFIVNFGVYIIFPHVRHFSCFFYDLST